MKKFLFLILILSACGRPDPFNTIYFSAPDSLPICADLYALENKDAPWILLCHQAGYSRGEYRETALKLNAMGYSCMALDQRSGEQVNGVINRTAKEAKKRGWAQEYTDAIPG